jgi:hypothetical protein
MTGPILQRPEGIRRKEVEVQITATKTTGVKVGNAIALGIMTVIYRAALRASLAEGQYLPNWPFLRLTDPLIKQAPI